MNIKSILTSILIGVVAVPTLAMGGSMVSSLIAGKTPDEAVQILATQMDILIDRISIVETKQAEQEQSILELQSTIEQQNINTESFKGEVPSDVKKDDYDTSIETTLEKLRQEFKEKQEMIDSLHQ